MLASDSDMCTGETISKFENKDENVEELEARFDIRSLDPGLQKLYLTLTKKDNHTRDYALTTIFNIRTAIELHRAWHVSLFTNRLLEKVKAKYGLTMNWHLGVFRMTFLVDGGRYQLQRRVPYDYDSQNQDLFMKIAWGLCEKDFNVDEALILQDKIINEWVLKETYTKRITKFLREFPGRLILYPALSSTCAVIFFGGDWEDAGVAAITGLATGISTLFIEILGRRRKRNYGILVDIAAGLLTGLIGTLFYRFNGKTTCLSSVFLGTLYWFFYGTAFVVGLLEIVAGQVETGVTRFMAVTIKTFVLSMSTVIGMDIIVQQPANEWQYQKTNNCGQIDLDVHWWRIPLYLACSAAALGQYRVRFIEYWRGLIVQLVGYEVQYQVMKSSVKKYNNLQYDHTHIITANIAGACSAVVTAFFIAKISNYMDTRYYEKMNYFNGSKDKEENTVIYKEPLNKWSIFMPALYQLVPGSVIANLWFSVIFPPTKDSDDATNVLGDLMISSLSLSMGLIGGFLVNSIYEDHFGEKSYSLVDMIAQNISEGEAIEFVDEDDEEESN